MEQADEKRKAAIAGLRAFADFCEQTPDFPVHQLEQRFLIYCTDADEFRRNAKALRSGSTFHNKVEKGTDANYYNHSRRFGPVEIFLYTKHEVICKRVVTLKELPEMIVPAKPAEPKKHYPARTVEEVKWECPKSIFEQDQDEIAAARDADLHPDSLDPTASQGFPFTLAPGRGVSGMLEDIGVAHNLSAAEREEIERAITMESGELDEADMDARREYEREREESDDEIQSFRGSM